MNLEEALKVSTVEFRTAGFGFTIKTNDLPEKKCDVEIGANIPREMLPAALKAAQVCINMALSVLEDDEGKGGGVV